MVSMPQTSHFEIWLYMHVNTEFKTNLKAYVRAALHNKSTCNMFTNNLNKVYIYKILLCIIAWKEGESVF